MRTMYIFVVVLLVSCASDNPVASDGTEVVGERGPQGDVGPRGYDGPQGEVGPAGPQGVVGETGQVGPQGEVGLDGAQGGAGPQGGVGPVGAQGVQGVQGLQGATGSQGPTGAEGPIGPASTARMMYVSSTGDVLGLMVVTSTPTYNEGMVMSPGFYSEGATIEAGWVVPSEPTAIYWSGTQCGQGDPYLRVGVSRPLVENQLYWNPGSALHPLLMWQSTLDNVLIKSWQEPTGSCRYAGLNWYLDDMMMLDITPVASSITSTLWTVTPESSLL